MCSKYELQNERKRLEIEIRYLEDDLIRCRDRYKQEQIMIKLNVLRRKLGQMR